MGRLFGTDGIRGIAGEMLTCELATKIGRAAAEVLSGLRRRPLFVIGKDTRASSDMLESAIAAGLCSVGADVIFLGVVPTPAVAYLIGKCKADAGVMISASHNAAEFNGIKIFGGDGVKLPDMLEEQIEAIVLDGASRLPASVGTDVGQTRYATEAIDYYVNHLKSTVPFSLSGLRVAVDCANGSASVTAKRLFAELGAQAEFLACEPDGANINRDCGSTHLEALKAYVVEHGMDAGVAFDGDADRCLCVDEHGEEIDGDFIMAICAEDMRSRGKLEHNAVVGTIMTNMGFSKFCEEKGLHFIATKVGDRYVLEEMLRSGYSFGGEQSGHLIFRDFATTGDGQLTAIQLLSIMARREIRLSELASVMLRYPQELINVQVSPEGKIAFYTDPCVHEATERARQELGENGRIIIRVSGTEPLIRVMVEGRDIEQVRRVCREAAEVVRRNLS